MLKGKLRILLAGAILGQEQVLVVCDDQQLLSALPAVDCHAQEPSFIGLTLAALAS